MKRCGSWTTIAHGDLDQDVFSGSFRVFHENVEVAILVKYSGIEQLVLEVRAASLAVRFNQLLIRVGFLRIFVEVLHVGMRGRRIEIEVILLYVLAVVS